MAYDNECTGAAFFAASGLIGPFELNGIAGLDLQIDAEMRAGVYDGEGNVLAAFRLPRLPGRGETKPVKFEIIIVGARGKTHKRPMVCFAASNSKHELFYQFKPDVVKPVEHKPAVLKLLGD